MSLGKRQTKQEELFIPMADLAKGPGHPFYTKLNEVLGSAGFDEFVEELCAQYYKQGGRPSIPPGVYFRMLLIGYFEGLDSQRGIAWRCADSLGLRAFLGIGPTEATPVHASMTIIRKRLPESVFFKMFVFVLTGFLAHDAFHRRIGFQRGGVDGHALAPNQSLLLQQAQHKHEHLVKNRLRQSLADDGHRSMHRCGLSRSDAQKGPQAQTVGATPGDSALAVQTFEVADQKHPKINSRWDTGSLFSDAFDRLLRRFGQPARNRLALRRQSGPAGLSGHRTD